MAEAQEAPYWEALIRFAASEGNDYIDRVDHAGGWDRHAPREAASFAARAMLMYGFRMALAYSALHPDEARTVYDQLTRDELRLGREASQEDRLDHVRAV